MLKNKKFLFVAAFFAFSLLLVACGGGDDNGYDNGDDNGYENGEEGTSVGVSGYNDHITIAIGANPASRDPHGQNDTPSSQIHRHVFERLVEQDYYLNINPGLAESWEQIDERTWEFNIRQGVTFHDGTPLTASDVAFTMTRAAGSSHVAPFLGMIDPDTINVVDDYTVQIGTEYPFAPFLAHLAHPAAGIISEYHVGDTPTDETTPEQLVGSGPYIITAFMSDDHLVLERWDDFSGEAPNMRVIDLRIMPDTAARLAALETGAVDMIMAPAPADVDRILNDANFYTATTQSLGFEYMGMNFDHPYLGIPEVRQAINYALDIATIVDVATEGTANPISSFIPSNVFGYHPGISLRTQNIDRAQELMDEAGVEGFTFEIMTNQGNVARAASAEIIQHQLGAIGIDVTIITVEWAAYLATLDASDFDAFMGGWGVVTGDADYALFPLFHSAYHPASNRVRMASDYLDALLESARVSVDEAERISLYAEIQEYLYEAAPFVMLSNNNLFVPMLTNVRNFVIMPHQGHYWGDIYFAD
ncbi:MAG: ABC transporter substrate-binding protein [Turicibacter sp.]|nr:ABC transporter substrate-binding protein [Turicibacter sp.]